MLFHISPTPAPACAVLAMTRPRPMPPTRGHDRRVCCGIVAARCPATARILAVLVCTFLDTNTLVFAAGLGVPFGTRLGDSLASAAPLPCR